MAAAKESLIAKTRALAAEYKRTGQEATQSTGQAVGGVNDLTAAFSGLKSLVASLGLAYAVKRGADGVGEALRQVDDYRRSVISIAATLTDTVKGSDAEIRAAYDRNIRYAETYYNKVEAAAAKYFASGKELIPAGAAFLPKPFTLEALESRVRDVLDEPRSAAA